MQLKKKTNLTDHKAEFIKLIDKAAYRHGRWTIFSDFLLMAATSISNSIDKPQFETREKEYMETIQKYDKAELALFPKMLSELVLSLQQYAEAGQPSDVLGEVFHELEIQNKWNGQFFSPQNICDMMGEILISRNDCDIARKGYLTINEPCSGGGAMLFGFARAMAGRKYNYCKQMLVEASDVDIKCVYMAYIQLSLYGIPAVVYHRNTLTMETWSTWYTPIYIIDDWIGRQKKNKTVGLMCDITKNLKEPEIVDELQGADKANPAVHELKKTLPTIEEISLF